MWCIQNSQSFCHSWQHLLHPGCADANVCCNGTERGRIPLPITFTIYLNLSTESGAEQNAGLENALSQSFPNIGFVILTSAGLGFFINQSAPALFSSLRTQLHKKQGLFSPSLLVLMPLHQCFYYVTAFFFFLNQKIIWQWGKKITTQNCLFQILLPRNMSSLSLLQWNLSSGCICNVYVSIISSMAFRQCCGLSFLTLVKMFPKKFNFKTTFEGLVQVSSHGTNGRRGCVHLIPHHRYIYGIYHAL